MKKRISSVILVVVLLFSLSGCGAEVQMERKEDNSSMFVLVESTTRWQVVYHKETKVMYAVSNSTYNYGTFTVLLDADGNPMLWDK